MIAMRVPIVFHGGPLDGHQIEMENPNLIMVIPRVTVDLSKIFEAKTEIDLFEGGIRRETYRCSHKPEFQLKQNGFVRYLWVPEGIERKSCK